MYVTAEKSTTGGAWWPGIYSSGLSTSDYELNRMRNTHLKKMYAARRRTVDESTVEYSDREAIDKISLRIEYQHLLQVNLYRS